MSYRSFTRVLGGDTNLERKCRLLFGVSLLLLIVGAFWYAERLTRSLILESTRSDGEYYVQQSFLLGHNSIIASGEKEKGYRLALEELFKSTIRPHVRVEILKCDDDSSMKPGFEELIDAWRGESVQVTTDPKEIALLNLLWAEQQAQLVQLEQSSAQRETPEVVPANPTPLLEVDEAPGSDVSISLPPLTPDTPAESVDTRRESVSIDVVGSLRADPKSATYVYYQPAYWKQNCSLCHQQRTAPDGTVEWPRRAYKVVMPSTKYTAKNSQVLALLITAALVTVFLAMIALYVVVRYTIVKPLKHLRDVSEEVRRGNTSLRADLQTNDEFQELGDSFNRMLRHLVDAQMELRETNRQLDGRLDELAQANMQLFEMNRLKSDFLANMSHELRTPLNSIIGFADILQGVDSLDARHHRYAGNIARSGRSLLEIINDILDLAKIESGRMECKPVEFSVEALVHQNCDMVRSLSEEKNIDLEARVTPDLPTVFQDQGKVQQILTNLLSNAIKFTPEGGRITVSASRNAAEQLVLVVSDTGIGISEEDRLVIFEKFRQGSAVLGRDNLTREYSGTGLGLSIVKELCRLLEGQISFSSEVGKGTEFTVHLPWNWTKPARLESGMAPRLEDLPIPATP